MLTPSAWSWQFVSFNREVFKEPVLIRSGGGIYNYLYQLKSSLSEGTQLKVGGSNVLGKLQITWRTNLGEPGRLQTQNILGNVSWLFSINLLSAYEVLSWIGFQAIWHALCSLITCRWRLRLQILLRNFEILVFYCTKSIQE